MKKTNVKKIVYFLLVLNFLSCNDYEDSLESSDISAEEKVLLQRSKVEADQIPEVTGFIKKLTNKKVFSSRGEKGAPIFDTDNILKVIDSLNRTNYSFSFILPDAEGDSRTRIYNLVVGVDSLGRMSNPVVMRYTPDVEFIEEWVENDFSFAYFTGKISLHKYTDYLAPEAFSRDDYCPPEYDEFGDPIECIINDVSSGSTGGTSGGSYAPAGGVSGGCDYSMTWFGCNGPNSGTGHAPGPSNGSDGLCGDNSTDYGGSGWILNVDCPNYSEETYFYRNSSTSDCPNCDTGPSGSTEMNTFHKSVLKLDYYLNNGINFELNNAQLTWANINFVENQKIISFLLDKGRTETNLEFAVEALDAMMMGNIVDFDELFIETATPDDNYVYQGSKEYIPNPLVLSNGDQVAIEFGTTKSDQENANKKVATLLIEGISYAIEEANNNLSSSEKITSIKIQCTTNGKHSSTSNHSYGTAVDISKINGEKMSVSGVTDQIIELQKAMDNFEFVRENFGPHFKHKYFISSGNWNYNYNVGGHKDHIHFSVRD